MNSAGMIRRAGAVAAGLFAIFTIHAYELMDGPYWPDGTVTLQLKLGGSPRYSDGSNPNSTAGAALQVWNPAMARVQLAGVNASTGEGSDGNSANEVFFSNTIYGYTFGGNVLAVTLVNASATRRTEADVIVNQAETWDSYRGELQSGAVDLRRVLAHEFGHVLGLGHDYGNSLMNAFIGSTEVPSAADQDGVSFLYGNGPGNPARLPVLARTELPYDGTVTEGDGAAFFVEENGGSRPITYQWRKDGRDLAGATGAQFSIAATALADAGQYSVRLSNVAGAVVSRSATLTVNPPVPPTITPGTPEDRTVKVGQSAQFSVTISPMVTPPVSYQWRKGGAPLAGEIRPSFGFQAVRAADAGLYSVVVSNRAGSAESRAARLTVEPAIGPTVSIVMYERIINVGGGASIDTIVTGSPPLSYQWKKDGVALPGQTSNDLMINPASAADDGWYTVDVSNAAGSVSSTPVRLVVLPARAPESFDVRQSTEISTGGVTFTAGISSGQMLGTLSYQWYKDGQPIAGATDQSYVLASPSARDEGDYTVMASNAQGSATGAPVNFTRPPPEAAEPWRAAERAGDVVYFLFTSPARIERYDLVADQWLAPVPLGKPATALRPDATGLYVAFGSSVSRFALDGTGEKTVAAAAFDIWGLFVRGGTLILFGPGGSYFTSVRLSDGAVLGSSEAFVGINKPGSLSLAPTAGYLFGCPDGGNPSSLYRLSLNADGSPGGQVNTSYPGAYPDAGRTFVSPDERYVFEDTGLVFACQSMTYVGSLGLAFEDLDFRTDGRPVLLRHGQLIGLSQNRIEIGRCAVETTATRVFISGETAVLFAAPGRAGGAITKTRVSLRQLAPRVPAGAVTAEGLAYCPDTVFVGQGDVVYLPSRVQRNIFRWSAADRRYASPLPLLGAPASTVYSATADVIYVTYVDHSVTRIQPALSAEEKGFVAVPSTSTVMPVATGDGLLLYTDSSTVSHPVYTYDPAGALVQRVELRYWIAHGIEWSPANRRAYFQGSEHSSDSRIYSVAVLPDGTMDGIGWSENYDRDYSALLPPCRISPDGSRVVLGSGLVLEGPTLRETGLTLANPIDDAAWLGGQLYTARNTFAGVEVQRWTGGGTAVDARVATTGRLLRLLPLSGNRLVAVVSRENVPAFALFDRDLKRLNAQPPTITTQPASTTAAVGATATVSIAAAGAGLSYQWIRDGADVAGASSRTLALGELQPAQTGVYRVNVAGPDGDATSAPAIIGLTSPAKVTGAGRVVGTDIQHPNGNIFDQILVTGAAEAITASPGKVTRTSYVDADDDIVQVEFSGAGTLSLVLETVSGPAVAAKYNQDVSYMKGHARLVIAGADETTNVSIFTVGRVTAINQALFRKGVAYDGVADLASIAILSRNGRFGGLRCANASFFASKGLTGLYAPGVAFGALYLGNIEAYEAAQPVIVVGGAEDARITGGDLKQGNGSPIEVRGLTRLKFVDGADSHGNVLRAQNNQGVLMSNGVDVTAQIVVNPSP